MYTSAHTCVHQCTHVFTPAVAALRTEEPTPEWVNVGHVHDKDDIRDILHTHRALGVVFTEQAALLKDHRATGLAS